jgi:FlaA1/EpsC-like NDP-sugar epimerase
MFPTVQLESKIIPKNIVSIKLMQAALDLLTLGGAFGLAYLLRFDGFLPDDQKQLIEWQMLVVVPFQFCVLRLCKIHKFIWRYVSVREANQIVGALALAALPLLFLRLVSGENPYFTVVPFSIIFLDFFLATTGIVAIRVLRREIYETNRIKENSASAKAGKKSILLIGAGRAGVITLAELKKGRDLNYTVKGFIDDDSRKAGLVINGVEVVGRTSDIPRKVRELKIDHVLITLEEASRAEMRRILDVCKKTPVKVKTIPGLSELLDEKVIVSRIRNVEVEDLLGRAPVELDRQSIEAFLAEKVVLITGAGGSIGSELVRQLLGCRPEKLILVERCEFALFNIEREIRLRAPQCEIVPVIGDVCDNNRMAGVFRRYRPQVVFHAAAHKHVPMMEENAVEALKNNVLGTNSLGLLAGQANVEAFVLISTDKAVNPTSIMGSSKRVAEIAAQNLNSRFETRFITVRFGNVIGSNGSVIPIFHEQIKNGGPVTVTHPEMQRFFMTIPEASQLVLQAGAIGQGGEIFILDMGEPVKILDLARETIRLSGLKPDEDIQIVYTGIRPGEKLFEELENDKEQLARTIHPKIFIGQITPYPSREVERAIMEIGNLCQTEDDTQIRRFLSELIPEARLFGEDKTITLEKPVNKKTRLSHLSGAPALVTDALLH